MDEITTEDWLQKIFSLGRVAMRKNSPYARLLLCLCDAHLASTKSSGALCATHVIRDEYHLDAIVRKQQQSEVAKFRPLPRFVFTGKTGKI